MVVNFWAERQGRIIGQAGILRVDFRRVTMDQMDKLTERLKNLPSEMKLSYRWAYTGETMATYSGIGTLAAGLGSFVLFRGSVLRAGLTAIGTGFGAGMGFQKCNDDFERAAAKGDEEDK